MAQIRDYLIEEYLETVCPQCISCGKTSQDTPFIEGMLISRGGKIWMKRFCPDHGESESLYEEDENIWKSRFGWSVPTSTVTPDRIEWKSGLGDYANGLPGSHGQHTCILLLNITELCNFSCPTCFASANGPGHHSELPSRPSLSEISATCDAMIEREGGQIGVVMLSGGEPTLRKDLPKILQLLAKKRITRVIVNTNGRRIARDHEFVKVLSDLSDRVEIYLQFDSFEKKASIVLRGEDVTNEKLQAIAELMKAKICTTLVPTVALGVNDHEVGDIFRFGLKQPYVMGIAFQPVFGSGRGNQVHATSRITPTGIISRLSSQAPDLVSNADFVPLPCSHKDCCDIGYWVKSNDETWQSLISLIGRDELHKWIHLVSNTISFENSKEIVKTMVKEGILTRILSEQQPTSSVQLANDVLQMCNCVPGLAELVTGIWRRSKGEAGIGKELASQVFRVTIKQFMDAHTFHSHRLRQCCVHTGTFEEDPRRLSFCWRWMFSDASDFPINTHLKELRIVKQ